MARDVFLSYSVKDKVVADAIVARLEAESVTCWVAPRDVVPGADWGESIINAIESSRIMILIFSKSANESPQIKREVERAVNKEVYIIPFRVDDIAPAKKLEYFISTSQWMDAFAPPLERHLDNLAKTVKAVLTSPPLPKPVGIDTPANRVGPTGRTATAQMSRPSSRKSTLIAVAIAVLMIVGGAGWYLGHKRKAPYVTPAGRGTTENELPITKQLDVDTNQIAPITKQSHEENEPSKQIAAPESPPIAEPSIAPARGPWLFPDSSSRYLSATELSSLSPAELWRARNEIFARKGYKFSSPRGIAFAQTLGNYYRGVDDDQDRVFNSMNQYEQANVTLIQSIEGGR
jgi:hypothetical protein